MGQLAGDWRGPAGLWCRVTEGDGDTRARWTVEVFASSFASSPAQTFRFGDQAEVAERLQDLQDQGWEWQEPPDEGDVPPALWWFVVGVAVVIVVWVVLAH